MRLLWRARLEFKMFMTNRGKNKEKLVRNCMDRYNRQQIGQW